MPCFGALVVGMPYSNEDKRSDELAQKYGFYFVKTYTKYVQNETLLQIPIVLNLF
jgi:hypothetical protein